MNNSSPYELGEIFGRGAAGTVYRATNAQSGRVVAFKLFNNLVASQSLEQRFRAEVEIIASLEHPHIVPVYEAGDWDGRPYFTMKLLTGGTLAERLEDFRAPEAAVLVVMKAAEAIHYAHQRGILHRDLKPSNILLDDEGEPYVTDFGIAKRLTADTELTLPGSIVGTPAYMSPEQAEGRNDAVSTASDQYSLGAILFTLLTGELVHPGETHHEVLQKAAVANLGPAERRLQGLPKDLVTICLKALQKNPGDRYPSVKLFATDLLLFSRGEPIRGRRLSLPRRVFYFAKRRPRLVALILLLLSPFYLIIGWSLMRQWNAWQAQSYTYSFDDDLEGWTHVHEPDGWGQRFIVSRPSIILEESYKGDRFISVQNFGNRDTSHALPLWLRSPQFSLSKDARICFSLLGGSHPTLPPPTGLDDPMLKRHSQEDAWIGIALRRVSDGRFVVTTSIPEGKRSNHLFYDVDWKSELRQAIANDSPDERYTLELIDTKDSQWGWIALNHVRIVE